MDSDEEAELETPAKTRRPANDNVHAPKGYSRHMQRRKLSRRCRSMKLFGKSLVIDEVQATETRLRIQCLVASIICNELWCLIKEYAGKECYGCSVDHPSQLQHDWCTMATDEECVDMFVDSALTSLDIVNIHLNKYSLKTPVRVKHGHRVALKGLSKMFGFLDNNKVITIPGMNISDMVSDVHGGITSFFVYTDIVEHQRVGDAHVPLLRVVKIGEKRPGEHITLSYNNPHYIPVKSKQIENIRIDLRDDLGQLITFQRGRVIVKLHFRQSKSQFFL